MLRLKQRIRFLSLLKRINDLLLALSDGAPLTEERMYELCEECLQSKVREPLIRALGEAFTQPHILARCFQGKGAASDESGTKNEGELVLLLLYGSFVSWNKTYIQCISS